MAARPTTGINGRPVAISPRMAYAHDDQSGGGGLLSTLLCGGSEAPFLLCDDSPNEVDFDMNPTGVFVAVHTKQWNLASERVKVYPREASTWVVRFGEAAAENAPGVGSGSSDRFEVVAVASPKSGSHVALKRGPKLLRWRMLPLHAALLFGAPPDVVRTLLKAYPAGCSAHDDQGMLPLHLAFRSGASEDIVLLLLDAYPEAIERVDYKGRLPSMLAPKNIMSYSDSIGEAYIKGPAYYYWASRVATADRIRCETALTKQIKHLEENARISNERGKEMLDKTGKQLTIEIEELSVENVELKERMVWYETKYDGAEEKEKILVDHTNSLAERLRLTSLSEEHLATKLAKIETKLRNKETELNQARKTAAEEKKALESRVREFEQTLGKKEHKAESLTEKLEKKIMESNEMKVRFEKERQLFEKQIDASKECLMELIASSKQDKRVFEADSKELRQQLVAMQFEAQKASMDEKRMFEEETQELRRQLVAVQNDARKAAKASKNSSAAALAAATVPQSLEKKLDQLRKEVADNSKTFMSHVNVETEERNVQYSSTRKIEDRLNSLQKEMVNARSYMSRDVDNVEPAAERIPQQYSYSLRESKQPAAERSARSSKRRVKVLPPPDPIEEEDPFDTYVSVKSRSKSIGDQTRDDTEFSHQSDVDTAMALGELGEDQRLALEQLDLSGNKEEIAAMLSRVPGLTKNQVNLLVDVASSLAV